ncbi:neuropeptide-like protein 31 [Drosophila innubila]|uniref:neuropeptide-like protein 31 n=1 Tax=Drosophila innubila TaxID=198719 RepID=UPI00148DD1B7|nr:neuropeptide-like protein 31 [Drosophila innubila]
MGQQLKLLLLIGALLIFHFSGCEAQYGYSYYPYAYGGYAPYYGAYSPYYGGYAPYGYGYYGR